MVALFGIGLFFLGVVLMLIAGLWGIILAFQESIVWGLLYLFVPFAALIFIIQKWSKIAVRNSFFLYLMGLLTTVGGGIVSSVSGPSLVETNTALESSPPDRLPSEITSFDPTVQTGDPNEPVPPLNNSTANAPTATISQERPEGYHQTMMIGYTAYNKGDYQSALINFRRALEIKPGDRLAIEAIQNTEAIIQIQ